MSRHHLDSILAAFPAPPHLFAENPLHRAREALSGSQLNTEYENTENSFELFTDPEKDEAHSQNSVDTNGSSTANFQMPKINLRNSRFSERIGTIVDIVECSSLTDLDASSFIHEQVRNHLPPKQFVRKPKKQRWRRHSKQIGIFVALCLAIWFFVPFPLFNARTHIDIVAFSPKIWSCNRPGFISGGTWNLIGIDIRFGRLTFGQAKGLDVAWNWVAGHGLQLVLSLIAYRVFTDALMRATELTHVSYRLFTSIALFSTKTDALSDLAQGLLTVSGWRTKFIIGWLLFSTAYISIFPSLMDVISGYEASYNTVLVLPNKTTLTLDGLSSLQGPLYYTVCRGNRAEPKSCAELHIEFYDPVLNTSYSKLWEWHVSHEEGPRPLFYAEVPENFNCVAEENKYDWGFSGEWVLIVGCVNSFWLFGLWILWLDCHSQSEFCKKGRRMGVYRAIIDIAEAIRRDLGPNLSAYSEGELVTALRQQSRIKYHVSNPKSDSTMHIGLSSKYSGRTRLHWDRTYA